MNHPIDTYRDSFLKFMAEGMSYREALENFDESEFQAAAMEEMESGMTRTLTVHDGIEKAGKIVTNDERELPSLMDLMVHAQFEKRNSVDGEDYQQALELWQAGWTSESHEPASGFWGQSQVMGWYWRRPPRRPGKPGRRYLSTNQAWMAMKREQGEQ